MSVPPKVNPEEFLYAIIDCYEAFKEVMKRGNSVEKILAVRWMYNLQQKIKVGVEEFPGKQIADMNILEKALTQSDQEFGQKYVEAKQRLIDLRHEIEPILEKERVERKRSRKKSRKRNMENKLRVKE